MAVQKNLQKLKIKFQIFRRKGNRSLLLFKMKRTPVLLREEILIFIFSRLKNWPSENSVGLSPKNGINFSARHICPHIDKCYFRMIFAFLNKNAEIIFFHLTFDSFEVLSIVGTLINPNHPYP